MNKIINIQQAIEESKKAKKLGKKIVLAGGAFDILHIGHVKFLEEAKKSGDLLFVLLESDEKIKNAKGEDRPINSQKDRAEVLSSLCFVNFVVLLPNIEKDAEYDELIVRLKPDIIATTKGDPHRIHKERQAKIINTEVIDVIDKISNQSTTRLIKILKEDYWL